jgi:hypothetical protein
MTTVLSDIYSTHFSVSRSFFVQNAAGVKQVMREIQALSAGVQLLQARMNKLALGKSDEGVVKSKVGESVTLSRV